MFFRITVVSRCENLTKMLSLYMSFWQISADCFHFQIQIVYWHFASKRCQQACVKCKSFKKFIFHLGRFFSKTFSLLLLQIFSFFKMRCRSPNPAGYRCPSSCLSDKLTYKWGTFCVFSRWRFAQLMGVIENKHNVKFLPSPDFATL